jgi:ferredoxin-NADP reductase
MGFLLLKGLVAGLAAGTIATFAALTLLLPLNQSDSLAQAQTALRQTTSGAGVGGLAGLLWAMAARRRRRRSPWQGWRHFVVQRKHQESTEISSFVLCPVDRGSLPPYRAGQFLTLELHIPGESKPVLRTYSLSDFPVSDRDLDHYRISVKREPSPKGLDVPPGIASNFLHDQVQEGTTLNLRPPAGSFVLDTIGDEPIVLVSNGVGITPMLAMLKAAVVQMPQRQIWFVHGCRNSDYHAFRGDVEELARTHPNVHLHVAYSRPLPGDEGHYQTQGYVDGGLLHRLIQGPAAYYLCGSPAFMDSLVMALQQAGVKPAAIRYERFSQAPRADQQRADAPVISCEVQFCRSGLKATWDGSNPEQSLLELAETNGLQPASACRSGVCGTCTSRVRSGDVAYLAEPTAEVEPGSALICIARPASTTLELDQ